MWSALRGVIQAQVEKCRPRRVRNRSSLLADEGHVGAAFNDGLLGFTGRHRFFDEGRPAATSAQDLRPIASTAPVMRLLAQSRGGNTMPIAAAKVFGSEIWRKLCSPARYRRRKRACGDGGAKQQSVARRLAHRRRHFERALGEGRLWGMKSGSRRRGRVPAMGSKRRRSPECAATGKTRRVEM